MANAKDLYANRLELLPYIVFGPRIEADLKGLQPPAFFQVVEYLYRLNDAVEAWEPQASPSPEYPPNTSDESESRKRLCQFPDPDGGYASFTWHGRYTPGAGRIHFRVERNPKRVILGYIGKKTRLLKEDSNEVHGLPDLRNHPPVPTEPGAVPTDDSFGGEDEECMFPV